MKKLVLLSLAATVITGSAFAASVPVTKISDNSTKIQADYAFNQRVSPIAVALTMMALVYL